MNKNRFIEKLSKLKLQQSKREDILSKIEETKENLEKIKKEKAIHEESSSMILQFMETCRDKSKSVFEELGTTALSSVFGEGYDLKIEYSENRRSSVANINIGIPIENNEKVSIDLDQCGGGMVDLLSMVFCISQLELMTPTIEGPILSDEYFKFLSDDLRAAATEVILEIINPDNAGAAWSGRQLIMITHAKEFLQYADKIWYFRKIGDTSHVEDVSQKYSDAVGLFDSEPETSDVDE